MKTVRIFCAETVKDNVQLLLNIFFYVEDCVAASRNISMFFKERAAASKKILMTASEKKICAAFSQNYVHLRNILKWKQIKIKTMEMYSSLQPATFMHFWLNYCNGYHHIARIPVGVKDIDHLFNMVSEIIEADNLHLFLLSDGTRIDDNEYLSSLENGTELIVCTGK